MRILPIIVILFSCLPAAFAAEAQPPAFDELLARLLQHPEIQAYATRAESSRHYAAGELGLPDPMLNFEVQDYPIGSSSSSDFEEKMIGFRQEIPRPALRQARSEKMRTEARKTVLLADYAFAAMRARLIAALASRQGFREQEKLLDEQENLFRAEGESIKGRIAANQSAASRFSMNRAEDAEVAIMRAELAERAHESEAMLVNMIGEAPEVALPAVKMAVWDNDPEKTYPVRIAAEDVAASQKEVETRTAEFGPNFEVAANVGRMNNGDNAGTIMFGVSIPLWSAESQKPRLAGAQAALRSSRLDLDSVKRGVLEKLNHLKAQIGASDKKMELLKTKSGHLEESAKALTREYGAGKADLGMYLKARRDSLSARMALAQERAKNIALIADFNRYFIERERP